MGNTITVQDYAAIPKPMRPRCNYKGETVTDAYRDASWVETERYVVKVGFIGYGSKRPDLTFDLVPADNPPSPDMIHLAHDMLESIVLGNMPLPDFTVPAPDQNYLAMIKIMANTLCWVLGHTGNPMVAHELYAIDQWLRAHGFAMVDTAGNPVLQFPEPPAEEPR